VGNLKGTTWFWAIRQLEIRSIDSMLIIPTHHYLRTYVYILTLVFSENGIPSISKLFV